MCIDTCVWINLRTTYMPKTTAVFIALFASLLSINSSAQTYSGFSDYTIVLKSDTTTHSVLISNLLEDRVGDISPIIGSAAWSDNNKKLQCRSLLYFNYGMLPHMITPEQITQAKLILQPVEINTVETVNGLQASTIVVRRIMEPWEDSMTSWVTQPSSNPNDEVVKYISENKRGKTVKIDVTDIVKNMFRDGNNGFMFRFEDSLETTSFLSQWFASARFGNEKLRPQLMISWSIPRYYRTPQNDFMVDVSPLPDNMHRPINDVYTQQGIITQPVITQMPTQTPPTIPPKGDDPKPKSDN